MKKRLVSLLLALALLIGMLPIPGLAAEAESPVSLGKVRVIVENNTASPAPGGGYGAWAEGAEQWSGIRVDTQVDLYADSTMLSCVAAGLEGHSVEGLDSGWITAIDGLTYDTTSYAGWMGSLNGWFTSMGFSEYTYARGNLRSGDEIRLVYSLTGGSDVGSLADSKDKKLQSLSVENGELSRSFTPTTTDYELVLGEAESLTVSLDAQAANRNFLVCAFRQDMTVEQAKALAEDSWFGENALRMGQRFQVSKGDVITVVVGAPNWPSMANGTYGCNAELEDPWVYRITAVEAATETGDAFGSFFSGLEGVATVENSDPYPMQPDEAENALVSSNAAVGSSVSGVALTFQKTAKLSFAYKTSCEKSFDYLKITLDGQVLNGTYGEKANYSGLMEEYKTYSLEVQAGQTLLLQYSKDSSGDNGSDCVWLKDFAAELPYQVVFHANDGTGETVTQGIFGSAQLRKNTFTREGYRFDGWATSEQGALAYGDEEPITMDGGDVALYALWTKVWQVTFPELPEDAVITVWQDGAEQPVSQPPNTWILADGEYTFCAECFGYEALRDVAFTVAGADLAVSQQMTETAKQQVNFQLSGLAEDATATVTVKNSEGSVMSPLAEDPLVYSLPKGSYTYTVEAKGYQKHKEQPLTVEEEAVTISLTMVISLVWDGTTAVPEQVDGVYRIGTAEELAGFAKLVNEGTTDARAVLTADIFLNEEDELTQKWTPIGNVSGKAYTGSFSGGGHSIFGLYLDGKETAVGLFGYIGQEGTVEELTISGASVKSTAASSAYAGLVAASNKGQISGIRLEDSQISGGFVVGGVAGLNEGIVTGCGNESAQVEQNTAKDQGVGGIVGQNKGTVSLSYNKAHIIRGHQSTNYAYLGGIVGKQESGGRLDSCYNLGEVDLAYYTGGLVGNGSGTLSNSFNAGTVPSNKKALIGSGYPTVESCYYLDSCGAGDTRGTAKTADEFLTLAASLGGAFEDTKTYPRLKWENPNATFSLKLTVSPAGAQVAVEGLTLPQPTTDPTTGEAVYVWENLNRGEYPFRVSCDAQASEDYVPQSGTVALSVADVTRKVTLEQRTYDVAFRLEPENASLTVTQQEQTLTPAQTREDGAVVYALPMGSYSYQAEAFGYVTAQGTFTVAKTEGLEEQTISLTWQSGFQLRFTGVPDEAEVIVRHAAGGVQQPQSREDGVVTYTLVPEIYTYLVKKPGCVTVKGEVTLAQEDQTLPVTMEALAPWDGTVATEFVDGSGTRENPYEIESGKELAYLSKLVADQDPINGADTYYVLTADIDLAQTAFAPIGMDSSHSFSGHFDGGGHTISNLKVTRDASLAGLFGRVSGSIANLTLDRAQVSNTSGNTGALAGAVYSGSGNSITNCLVKNSSVTGGSNFTGGLVGYCAVDVTHCAVTDSTVSGNDYTGGLLGQNGKNITGCYVLKTTVTGSGEYAGGLIGGGNASKIASCFVRGTVSAAEGYAGGIIGNGGSYSKASIQKSYAVADVTAESGSAGALAGGSYVTVTAANTFYCGESTLSGREQIDAGTEKTLAQLKDPQILTALGSEFAQYAQEDGVINAGLPYVTGAPALEKVVPQVLAAPTVRWEGKTAHWTAVENAQGYLVELTLEQESLYRETVESLSCDFTTLIDLTGSGSYTLHVTALGDGEAYSDSPEATQNTQFTVQTGLVTFNVTRSDGESFAEGNLPQIRVVLADGITELSLENGVAKALPLGSYTYRVSAKTFVTQTGSFALTEAGARFDLALEYSSVWDGETVVQPQLTGGVYQITNGYELAWFRDEVNKATPESFALNAILLDNIDLGGFDWTPISQVTSTSATKGYTGTFDGNGKTITGLKPVGSAVQSYSKTEMMGAGLFGYVYTGGTVKNVTVEGTMAAVKHSGGVVAMLAGGTVENCASKLNITLEESCTDGFAIGGVVGYMTNYSDKSARVIRCRNEGDVLLGTAGRYVGGVVGNASYGVEIAECANTGAISGGDRIGGIVGHSSIPLTACVNTGAVTGSKAAVGGIAGFANKETVNCFNSGTVTGTAGTVGGIIGSLSSSTYGAAVKGCLNTGSVTGGEEAVGALVGTKAKNDTGKAIFGSYFLAGTALQAVGENVSDTDETTVITAQELSGKKLIGLLGGAFASVPGVDAPMLRWQDPDALSVVTFLIPQGAEVTVEGQTAVPQEPGVYALTNGTYAYAVTRADYQTVTGSVTVDGESQSIAVTLEPVTYAVTFTVTTLGVTITVTDAQGKTIQPDTEDGSVFSLSRGAYTYAVTKFGFTGVTGSFTVEDQPMTIPAITLEGAAAHTVTLTFAEETEQSVVPASVTVTAWDGTVVTPDSGEGFRYTLPDGIYTYVVEDSRYYRVEEHFTVQGGNLEIPVTLEQDRSWDGTTQTPVTPNAEGIYEIGSAAELAWFAEQVAQDHTDYNARLTANIYINYNGSTNAWTPIGSYSHQYAGTFDGNGKAVYGLDTALFGYNGTGSLVKNLTVWGQVSGDSNVGGICNASYGSFENCENYMTVTATGQRVGGIVGVLYAGGHITNCVNFGTISTSHSGYSESGAAADIGGIVGLSYAPVSGCANYAQVTASSDSYGSSHAGGIAGQLNASPLTQCYNRGTVSAAHQAGGIVGTATGAETVITDCYSTGTITVIGTALNPQSGALAGTLMNSATLSNGYFLQGCYTYSKGSTSHTDEPVGYSATEGAWTAEKKLESEMKLDSFAIALSPEQRAFHMDSENKNDGYPVLSWQGGRVPELSQAEQDVAADKAALQVEPTLITASMQLELASQGAKGSTITWESSAPEIIAIDGTVTLPQTNDTVVTLTATITKDGVSDTKTFSVTVKTRISADQTALKAIRGKLSSRLRIPYAQGEVLAADAMKQQLDTAIAAAGVTGLTAQDITVTLSSAGQTAYGTGTLIGEDGKVTYYYADPAQAINGDATVSGVTFTLSTASGASVTTDSILVQIPWDQARVKTALNQAADSLSFDTIKGENTAADQVQTDLTLPQRLENYGWTLISWESSDESVISITGGEVLADFVGDVLPAEEDQQITLTACFTFNKNNREEDGAITVTKDILVTVPGASNGYLQTIQAALDRFTLDQLTYSVGSSQGQVIDPNAVTDAVQLPRPAVLGVDGGRNGFKVLYSVVTKEGTESPVTINGYRANVVRPIREEPVEVTVRLTITKQNEGVLNENYTGSKDLKLRIAPLKPSELQQELALLEQVKANFFQGLNDGRNVAADAVVTSLHPVQEAYLDSEGKLVWVYDYADRKDIGIVTTDLPGYDPMGSTGWRAFRSDNTGVLTHENLLVTCPKSENATVTLEANLASARFGGYYETYQNDETYGPIFRRLAGEQVRLTLTVISQDNQEKAAAVREKISAIGTVTLESAQQIRQAEVDYQGLDAATQKLVTNAQTLQDAIAELERLEQQETAAAIRIAGQNRYETACKTADELKAALGVEKFQTILVASGNDFADALAGSYLAAQKNAPILLSYGKDDEYAYLDQETIGYIRENLAENGMVYILGGTAAVPVLYDEALAEYTVKRLDGANRFATNLRILEEAGIPADSEILVCTGTNYADSLSASATGKPVLLVWNEKAALYGEQPAFLEKLENCRFTVIGGESAVCGTLADALGAYGTVERLAGENRFETSVMVAQSCFQAPDSAVLAYAWDYPDGLCGGVLAYAKNAPLILTMDAYEAQAVAYAKDQGITSGTVLGGEGLISDATVRSIFAMEDGEEILGK